MNPKMITIVVAAMLSNILKENVLSVHNASLGCTHEAWIGSGAFTAAVAMFLSTLVILPSNIEDNPTPLLYTYYTVMSILVSVLALKLIWVPVVDLLSEVNTILSKTILYINKFALNKKCSCVKTFGVFLGSKRALIWTTNLVGVLFLFAVSTNLLDFMGVYLSKLPRNGLFAKINTVLRKILEFTQQAEVDGNERDAVSEMVLTRSRVINR